MENKYLDKLLEKQANFIDNVTGRAVRHNHSVMEALSEAAAAGKTYSDYASHHPHLRKEMYKARAITGAGVLGVVGAGAYGLHRFTKHKQQQIMDSYNRILNKEAGFVSNAAGAVLKTVGNLTMSGGRAARKGIKGLAGLSNKTLGGHQGGFAEDLGMHKDLVKGFQAAKNNHERVKILKQHFSHANPAAPKGSPDRVAHQELLKATGKLKGLSKQRTDAKMGLAGLAAIPAYAYYKGSKSDQNADTNTNIYY